MTTTFFFIFIFLFFSCISCHQKIILGPIIGKVTSTTARVLVEFSSAGKVTMWLEEEDSGLMTSHTVKVRPSHPAVFKFKNLSPGVKYNVLLNMPTTSGESSFFRTLSGETPFNTVFLSCNHVQYTNEKRKNLWDELARRVSAGEVDYVFHIGDQVYLDSDEWSGREDSPYSKSKALYLSDSTDHTEEIRELIREDYRLTFSYLPTAVVLSRVPNVMQLDDHEIHNDIHRNASFRIKGTWEEFWSEQARFVYYQYQRQLREDVDFERFGDIPSEYFSLSLNGVDFFFLDYRAERVWNNRSLDDSHYLDRKQTEAVEEFVLNGKSNAKVFISTVPILVFNESTSKWLAENVAVDYDESWTYAHEEELIDLFNFLARWKRAGQREVFFVGGDLHFGFHSEIFLNGTPIFKQLTTSGIITDGAEKLDMDRTKALLRDPIFLSHSYSVNHIGLTFNDNFGLVKFNDTIIQAQLVTSAGELQMQSSDTFVTASTLPNTECSDDDNQYESV